MKLKLFNICSFVVGASLFPLGWYISGEPFPTHRGPNLLMLYTETPVFGVLGIYIGHLVFWDWYWKEKNK